MTDFSKTIKQNNPLVVMFLGFCPALALSNTLLNALSISAILTLTLVFSSIIISIINPLVSGRARILLYFIVTGGFVTVFELAAKAVFPSFFSSLGVYVPLLTVSSLILSTLDSVKNGKTLLFSALHSFAVGIGFLIVVCPLAAVREILGSGQILGFDILGGIAPLGIMAFPAGAFFALAFIIALFNYIKTRKKGGAK